MRIMLYAGGLPAALAQAERWRWLEWSGFLPGWKGMADKWAAKEKLKRKDLAAALLTAIEAGVQKV